MKAAVLFDAPGALRVTEVIVDPPGPHEVLVNIAATGLCHTDLHYSSVKGLVPTPAVMGHEGAGVVAAVGTEVSYVGPGDHVVCFSLAFCGSCDFCLAGQYVLCRHDGLVRPPGAPPRLRLGSGKAVFPFSALGTFAEQVLVHEHCLVKIDPSVPFECAALLGCAVPTGVGAVIRTAKVPPGANVAVIGCGGIGLNAVQGALIAGASRIIAIDISDTKLDQARKFGATDVINSKEEDPVTKLDELLPGRQGVDFSFEAIGNQMTYELAFSLLRPGGTATVMGVFDGSVTLPSRQLLYERKIQGSIMGSVNFRTDLPYFLNLYRAGRLKLDELVSKTISLEEINLGYVYAASGKASRVVVVFD